MSETDAARYTGLLGELKTHIFSEGFKERYRQSPKNFLRQRCLPFTIVVLFLLNMVKRSLQDELDEFFRFMSDNPVAIRVVSKSAWTQARKKLKHEAFIELNNKQVTYFYRYFEPVRWKGYRLVATDGSWLIYRMWRKSANISGSGIRLRGASVPKLVSPNCLMSSIM
jgi:hypothetical protein